VASVEELSLMPVTAQWLPVENGFERQQVEQLVRDPRSFIKVLRYNLARDQPLATVSLIDQAVCWANRTMPRAQAPSEGIARPVESI
jgi:hypothetical protein